MILNLKKKSILFKPVQAMAMDMATFVNIEIIHLLTLTEICQIPSCERAVNCEVH